jgi:hypothetical protein
MNSREPSPDFAVLHPDGRLEYGRRGEGESILSALRPHIDELGTQGMGRLRAFFSDRFASRPPNPLADTVLSSIGYHHPTGWYGTVAVSMEKDATGDCPPLTAEIRATLDELADR